MDAVASPRQCAWAAAPLTAVPFSATYGGTGIDQANSIGQTADGGYIMAGVTDSSGAGGQDAWVLKLIGDGDVAWSKTYAGSDYDRIDAIQQTADGGYIAAGRTRSSGAGGDDAWVLKLGGTGQVYGNCDLCESTTVVAADGSAAVWGQANVPADSSAATASSSASVKNPAAAPDYVCTPSLSPALAATYGGTGSEDIFDVEQTAEGGYVLAGETRSSGAGGSDAWILLLDANLKVVWQKTYGSVENDSVTSIVQATDGGFVAAGWSEELADRSRELWILKLKADGSLDWSELVGSVNWDQASDIQRTRNGSYVVAGESVVTPGLGSDGWVTKVASDGGTIWSRFYPANRYEGLEAIQQTSDGGYIVSGRTQSLGAGDTDAWVLKLDATGVVEWQKTYGQTSRDEAFSVQQTGAGQSVPFVFRARHVGDHEEIVTNTAQFACVALVDSAEASFTVEAAQIAPPPPDTPKVFLPLVLKNR